jgi:hypothetical protein
LRLLAGVLRLRWLNWVLLRLLNWVLHLRLRLLRWMLLRGGCRSRLRRNGLSRSTVLRWRRGRNDFLLRLRAQKKRAGEKYRLTKQKSGYT